MGSNFNFPLTRESSIYSLTFDEFQSTIGDSGRDFGSMNMDELLKSIWSAEENQTIGSTTSVGGGDDCKYLQKHGSLTLPRTLSRKTVDEVWRNMSKERDSRFVNVGFGVPQREPTLGEITLDDFLSRAGVVREDPPQLGLKNTNLGFFGDFLNLPSNSGLGFGYQTQQQILPKQTGFTYGAQIGIPNNSPRIRGGVADISDSSMNNGMVQNEAINEMVSLGANGVNVGAGSPGVSSDGLTKSNGDTSSLSPVPYVFNNGGSRGRKSATLEKVVERRQKRLIKNRESAARSRARKLAYTTELEAEIAKLKEENEKLRKNQEEIMEMQKNQQVIEMNNQQNGAKKRCLKRTHTALW